MRCVVSWIFLSQQCNVCIVSPPLSVCVNQCATTAVSVHFSGSWWGDGRATFSKIRVSYASDYSPQACALTTNNNHVNVRITVK